jgi:hypothetical protein
MKKRKKPKRNPGDPRGGFFKLFSRLWLEDVELINAGDDAQAGYVRIMCAVNEIDFVTGSFNTNGYPLPVSFICELSRTSESIFNCLVALGKLYQDKDGIWVVKRWEDYQDKSRLYGNNYRKDAQHDALVNENKTHPLTTEVRSQEVKTLRSEDVKTLRNSEINKSKTLAGASDYPTPKPTTPQQPIAETATGLIKNVNSNSQEEFQQQKQKALNDLKKLKD